jgi:hypothetical protein
LKDDRTINSLAGKSGLYKEHHPDYLRPSVENLGIYRPHIARSAIKLLSTGVPAVGIGPIIVRGCGYIDRHRKYRPRVEPI